MSKQVNTALRLRVLMFLFVLLFSSVLGRLFYLQIYRYQFFQDKVSAQTKRVVTLASQRGNIFDRNGLLLATNIDSYSVYADCSRVSDKKDIAASLSRILKTDRNSILEKLNTGAGFIWLKRKILDDEAETIKQLALPGIYLLKEQKRVYLRETLAAQLIGFVDIDNIGMGGVEYAFDRLMQGIPGKLIVDQDPTGREIFSGNRFIQMPRNGNSLELTIDEFLQYAARQALKKTVDATAADGGVALVMDVKTGAILAMVSLPDFDPNYYYRYPEKHRRNDAVQAVYEPGSVFKLITVSGAIDMGLVSPNTTFVNGNTFDYGKRTIREAHKLKDAYRPRTIAEIIIESLNIGAAKLGLKIGKRRLYQWILDFGFGQRTGLGLPGESSGIVNSSDSWSSSDEAIIPFGQSIAVTPIQMLAAVNVIANNGFYVKPRIVSKIMDYKGKVIKDYGKDTVTRRVVSPPTALALREMMQLCVAEGTGMLAMIPGYSLGGKTGTSQKVDTQNGGYAPGKYVSSFVGFVSGNQPQIAILVAVDTPKRGDYYGGSVAAPVFKTIAVEAIRYLSIKPDLPAGR